MAEQPAVPQQGAEPQPKSEAPAAQTTSGGLRLGELRSPAARAPLTSRWREYHAKLLAVLLFMGILGFLLVQAPWASETTSESRNQTTPPLAELMFEGFGASFVLLSLVMGVALIGGLFLAKEDRAEDDQKPGEEPREEEDAPPEAGERKEAEGEDGAGGEEKEAGRDGKGEGGGAA